ncbi:hypothetical protein HWV62_42490 [Athelia sp. TMB]|nr:hypothetical protein HWV62_42490 [Athelia sp. TMB]
MANIKASRIRTARLCIYEERFEHLDDAVYYATASTVEKRKNPLILTVDICSYPEIRELMDVEFETLDPDNWESERAVLIDRLQAIVPGVCARWAADRTLRLAQWTAVHLGCPPDLKCLNLATVSYDCTKCSQHEMIYPGVLADPCLNPQQDTFIPTSMIETYGTGPANPTYERTLLERYSQGPLTFDCLDMPQASTDLAAEVITACGYDPRTVTREEMDGSTTRLTHKKLPVAGSALSSEDICAIRVLSWRRAIPYWALYKDQHQLSIVGNAEAEAARPLETKLWARNAETPYTGEAPWWSCLHCIQRGDETVEALRRHWLDELSISS